MAPKFSSCCVLYVAVLSRNIGYRLYNFMRVFCVLSLVLIETRFMLKPVKAIYTFLVECIRVCIESKCQLWFLFFFFWTIKWKFAFSSRQETGKKNGFEIIISLLLLLQFFFCSFFLFAARQLSFLLCFHFKNLTIHIYNHFSSFQHGLPRWILLFVLYLHTFFF